MEKILLPAELRDERGRGNNQLRRDGILPGVVYGQSQEPLPIRMDAKTFKKVFSEAGESTLITLQIEGAGETVTIVKDVSYHPVSDVPTHVDFLRVNLKEELETNIEIVVEGESPAVKNLGAILVKNMSELKVRCLPSALVHNFTVSISELVEFGQAITVAQVLVPAGITVLEDPDLVVVAIEAPKAEETPVAAEEGASAEVQVLKQKSPEEVAAEEAAKKKDEKK